MKVKEPVWKETFNLKMPDRTFEDILSDEICKREEEGYTPNRVLMWMPIYFFYETTLKKRFEKHIKDFKLSVYIREQFGLEPIVIDLDEREHKWLKDLMFYVYEDPLSRKDVAKE